MIWEAEILEELVRGKTIISVVTVEDGDYEGFTLNFSDGSNVTFWGNGSDSSAHWIDFQLGVEQ